jgi:hypothetical protein
MGEVAGNGLTVITTGRLAAGGHAGTPPAVATIRYHVVAVNEGGEYERDVAILISLHGDDPVGLLCH